MEHLDNRLGETPEENLNKPPSKKNKFKEAILELIRFIVPVLVGYLLLTTFVVQTFKVHGQSMMPRLQGEEKVVVNKLLYYFTDPKKGEIVIVHPDKKGSSWIKRVIGLEGDKVRITGHKVYVNNELIEEPYINEPPQEDMREVVVPEGHIFVMGDNRNHSTDSRDSRVGPLPKSVVKGRAEFIFYRALN